MARILAITNQKGGVGKTTTTINLAASLVAMKRRVLVVDMDPQANATTGSGIDKHELHDTINDVLLGNVAAANIIVTTDPAGYDVLPANSDLTAAQVMLINDENREVKLKQALAAINDNYDYIVIDCPPTLSLLTLNALVAADAVFIPMQCEFYALEGASDLLNTIHRVQETVNPNLDIEGVVRTMYDPRSRLTKDVSAELTKHFGDKLYRSVIPRNIRLAEAPSYGTAVLHYDKRSVGANAYLALAGEMIRREDSSRVDKNSHESADSSTSDD